MKQQRETEIATRKTEKIGKSLDELRTYQPSTARTRGPVVSLIKSVRSWGSRLLALVLLEKKRAATSLAFRAGLRFAAGILLVTGWLVLVACTVVFLVQHEIVRLPSALIIAALLSFVGAGVLVQAAIQGSKDPSFPASRRQLRLRSEGDRLPHG